MTRRLYHLGTAGAVVVVAAATAVAVLHSALNALYRPFTGRADDLMHAVGILTAPAWLVVAVIACWEFTGLRILARFKVHPLFLLAVVLSEALYAEGTPIRHVGASSYRPLFPDFFAGPAIGVLAAIVASPAAPHVRIRLATTALLLLWGSGGFLIDLIYWVEGGDRGTSWIWSAPLIGPALTVCAALTIATIIGLGRFAAACAQLSVPWQLVVGTPIAFAALAVVTLPRAARGTGVVLLITGVALLHHGRGWISFFLD